MYLRILLFCAVTLLHACTTDAVDAEADQQQFTIRQLEALGTESVSVTPIPFSHPLSPVRSILVLPTGGLVLNELFKSDSILLHRGVSGEEHYLIALGEGPLSVDAAEAVRLVDGRLEFYDPVGRGYYETNTVFNGPVGQDAFRKVVGTPGVLLRDAFRTGGGIIGLPLGAGENTNRRFVSISSDGTVASNFGEMPQRTYANEDEQIDPRIANMVYAAGVAVRSDCERFVLAYHFKDRIEIYDESGTLLTYLDGPDGFDPLFRIADAGGGVTKQAIVDETRNGYLHVAANDHNIFALYSGKLYTPSDPPPGYLNYTTDRVLVFNWEGELVGSYRLPLEAYSLAVENDGTIYVVSGEEDTQVYRVDM